MTFSFFGNITATFKMLFCTIKACLPAMLVHLREAVAYFRLQNVIIY